MLGKNFLKSIIWNLFANKIPGHPRKTSIGRFRNAIGRQLVTSASPTSVFSQYLDLRGFDIVIGDNSGLGYDCIVMTGPSHIIIGNGVTMGSRVMLICNSHDFYEKDFEWKEEKYSRPIIIKDECFIASGAIILGGVTIGPRSIVGAGAVVTKDVPPNSFVGGVPARVIRSTKR
jgi:maltose O-acetyltransferase